MRALGVIPMPAYQTGYAFKDIQSKCQDYAQAKAVDDLKSGTVSDLTSIQNDIDACTQSMDRARQIRQGLILSTGLIATGFLGFLIWKKLG
jgi:hypothetical protein